MTDIMRAVPVNQFSLHEDDKLSVLEALNNGWVSSEGPYIEKFESDLARRFNIKHVSVVSSGTAALDLAVRSLELPKGFTALVSDHTIISCASAIVSNGGRLILVDSDRKTWNQDVNLTLAAIERYHPDVVLISHVYGLPFQISKIKKICEEKSIPIIEDAAEMIGNTENGAYCGTIGDINIFSFYPNKHITTGEGGAVLTNSSFLDEKVRYYRNLCFNKERRFLHYHIGYNYRMSSMQAALGISQLSRLNANIKKKRLNGNLYSKYANDLSSYFNLPLPRQGQNENIYWVFGLVLKDSNFSSEFKLSTMLDALGRAGIGTRPFFYSLHDQPSLKNNILNIDETFASSKYLSTNGFYLPSGLDLSSEDIDYVCETLLALCQDYAHI